MRGFLSAMVGLAVLGVAGGAQAGDRHPDLMGGPDGAYRYDDGPHGLYDAPRADDRYMSEHGSYDREARRYEDRYEDRYERSARYETRLPDRYGPSPYDIAYADRGYDHGHDRRWAYGRQIPTYGYASQNYGHRGAGCNGGCGACGCGGRGELTGGSVGLAHTFFYDAGGVGNYGDAGAGYGGGYAVVGAGSGAYASSRASASAYSSSSVNVRIGGGYRGGGHKGGGGCKGGCGGGKH